MRYWIALTGLLVLGACTEKMDPQVPMDGGTTDPNDAGTTPSGVERPSLLERPPTGPGLPADLKPPGR
ncbi:hypothetical protein P2318_07745 [Myxococcaceae bacterium GXIMD 01537]